MALLLLFFATPILLLISAVSLVFGAISQALPVILLLTLLCLLGGLLLLPFQCQIEYGHQRLNAVHQWLEKHNKWGGYFAILAFTLTLIYHLFCVW